MVKTPVEGGQPPLCQIQTLSSWKDMQDSNRLIHLQRVTCYHYTNVLCGRLRVLFLCLLAETSRPWGLASPQSCVLLTPSSASCPMVQVPHGFIRIG